MNTWDESIVMRMSNVICGHDYVFMKKQEYCIRKRKGNLQIQ